MNTLECKSEGIYSQIVFSISVISILILYFLYKLFSGKKAKNLENTDSEILEILKLKTEIRAHLEELSVKERSSVIPEKIFATLEQNHANTAKKFEKQEKAFTDFKKETFFLRDCLDHTVKDEKLIETEVCRTLVEIGSQTRLVDGNGIKDVSGDSSAQEESCIANSEHVQLAIKECMEEITNSSNVNWENFILEISSSIKQYHKNIEDSLKYNSTDKLEKMSKHQFDKLMAKLLEISILSDRKLVQVHVIEDILNFFNVKFIAFADKCQAKWSDSCTNFDDSIAVGYEAKDNLIFSSSKMSRITCSLDQQLTDVDDIAKSIVFVVQKAKTIAKPEALDKANTKRIEKIVCVIDTMKDTMAIMEEDYCLKLEAISGSLDTPRKKLESFIQYVEDQELFSNLKENMADRNVTGDQPTCGEVNNDHLEDLKDLETSSMISGDGLSSCRFGESVSEMSYDVNRSMINKRSRKDVALVTIVSLLNNLLKKKEIKFDAKGACSEEGKLLATEEIEKKLKQEDFNWSSIPSEVNLFDINSDCLEANSCLSSEED